MLPRVEYGRTGLRVSRLCFGTGQMMDPSRFAIPPERGAELLRYAYSLGVNFFDTAISYRTHPHVRLALDGIDRSDVVINTKTGAATSADARAAVEQCLTELRVDQVDVILLHGVRSADDLRRREGALAELCRAKEEGLIRAVGASTHVYTGSAMRACIDDPRIEVMLVLANKTGVGLRGSYDEHLGLMRAAHDAGKAVCAMKVLGEGYMADDAEEFLRYAFDLPTVHAVDLGMISEPQIEMAVCIARGEAAPPSLRAAARKGARGEWGERFPNAYS